MDLTRTERLLLETAAELFDIGMSPAEAAVVTDFGLTAAEQAQVNGARPQLGDLLVGRGLLSSEQLETAFDRVFDELKGWSDSLATPQPEPLPRPPPQQSSGAQISELVKQLANLLDVLVGATPAAGAVRLVRAAPGTAQPVALGRVRTKTQAEVNLGDNLLGHDPTAVFGGDDPDDDEDTAKLAAGEDEDEDTRDGFEEEPPTGKTLQVERSENSGSTLQIERPEPVVEGEEVASPIGERSDDTLQLERPAPQGA
jgi:hypothetical protein